MNHVEDSWPLNEFLQQSYIAGREMARIYLGRGETNAGYVLRSIEDICWELCDDWGVTPGDVEAGIRMYLDGARRLLADHDALNESAFRGSGFALAFGPSATC